MSRQVPDTWHNLTLWRSPLYGGAPSMVEPPLTSLDPESFASEVPLGALLCADHLPERLSPTALLPSA